MTKVKKLIYIILVLVVLWLLYYFNTKKSNFISEFSFSTYDSLNTLIIIKNSTDKCIKFNFSLNNRFYSSLNDFIRKNSSSYDSEKIVLNLFNSFINSIVHEKLFNNWGSMPLTRLNSTGFAICGWQSEIFSQIMYNAGFRSRVICLNGHVVSEIFYNGRWHLFDVDRKLFFKSEKILGYKELTSEPFLFKKLNPKAYLTNLTAFSEDYKNFFITKYDNNFIYIKNKNKDTFLINLPSKSSFIFPYFPDFKKDFFPYNTKAKLFLPKGFRGKIKNPLIIVDAEGEGIIKYKNKEFSIPKHVELLKAEIFLSQQFEDEVYVKVFSDSLSLVYMLNPIFSKLGKYNKLILNASDSLNVGIIKYNETSNSIIYPPIHIDLLNHYTLQSLNLINKNILHNVKNISELYEKKLKQYCINYNIDTLVVKHRLLLVEKLLNNTNLSLLNHPTTYSILTIILHGNDNEFKGLFIPYYKYNIYKNIVCKYDKCYN